MASAASKKRKPPSVTNQILAVCKEHDGQGGVAQKVLENRLAANDVKSADDGEGCKSDLPPPNVIEGSPRAAAAEVERLPVSHEGLNAEDERVV